jgi:hypothetical protein
MTAHSALKDRRIKELEAQKSQLRSNSNSILPPGRGGGAGRGAGDG